MILARGDDRKNKLLLIGLSRENVTRLLAAKPILITRKSHGDAIPEGWTFSIVYGETEQQIAAELQRAGMIGPSTDVHIDPRLHRS